MKVIDSIKNRLLDIEMPSAPPEAIDYTSTIITLISISVLVTLTLIHFYSPAARNKRTLSTLSDKLSSSLINPRHAAYAVADILKSAHNTTRLTTSQQYPQELNDFISRLSRFRYQASHNDKDEIIMLIKHAKRWLKAPLP